MALELTISRLAKQARVNVATVRYYERRGLIPKPKRSAAGYRLYTEDAVARLHFIANAKTLGFTLKEVVALLALERDPANACLNTQTKIVGKIAVIDAKITMLKKIKKSLLQLSENCGQPQQSKRCSITRCLNADAVC